MEKNNNKKSSRTPIIMGVSGLILVLLLVLFGLKSCSAPSSSGEGPQKNPIGWDTNSEEGEIAHKSQEEIEEELNEKVREGMINISMNTSPVFADGASKGNLLIYNSEKNLYPQVVYIVLKDTGEEIYRSGAIPVGSRIENAKLAVDLDKGEYDCIAYFNNVNVETGEFLGTAGAEIKIVVSA